MASELTKRLRLSGKTASDIVFPDAGGKFSVSRTGDMVDPIIRFRGLYPRNRFSVKKYANIVCRLFSARRKTMKRFLKAPAGWAVCMACIILALGGCENQAGTGNQPMSGYNAGEYTGTGQGNHAI
jgi:hypothetical protein